MENGGHSPETWDTLAGPVPRVDGRIAVSDRWASLKVRLGIGRMRCTVEPGLHALGRPEPSSPVLVTANYKLSFDHVRKAMEGRDAWLLVLDTGGINVWCAAGKGSFGTEELIRRVEATRLSDVVAHRRLVLPQLGAPGVAAHLVEEAVGFRVRYGPIQAADLPAYLDAGMKATPEMRRRTFGLGERLVLVPMELFPAAKALFVLAVFFFLVGGLGGPGSYAENLRTSGGLGLAALTAALLTGSVLTPLLLPWLPGRAFSVKGLPLGVIAGVGALLLAASSLSGWQARLEGVAWLLIVPALATFLALNFTGASTYTSLSGVRTELRRAVPVQIAAGVVGLCLWIGARFSG